jgi:hypothetical protein
VPGRAPAAQATTARTPRAVNPETVRSAVHEGQLCAAHNAETPSVCSAENETRLCTTISIDALAGA